MSGSSWRGMQPERVHDVINRLAQAKQTLATAVTTTDTAVNRLKGEWHGGDAQTFFSGWPSIRHDIAASADHVEQLRRVLDHEYQEQRRVSGAGGDSDGDGVPDRRDGDDDGDGTPDGTTATTTTTARPTTRTATTTTTARLTTRMTTRTP